MKYLFNGSILMSASNQTHSFFNARQIFTEISSKPKRHRKKERPEKKEDIGQFISFLVVILSPSSHAKPSFSFTLSTSLFACLLKRLITPSPLKRFVRL